MASSYHKCSRHHANGDSCGMCVVCVIYVCCVSVVHTCIMLCVRYMHGVHVCIYLVFVHVLQSSLFVH